MLNIDDIDLTQAMPEPEPDRPGFYYVTMYLPVRENAGPGELEDSTTMRSYRARSVNHAKERALAEFPEATITNVDYHDTQLADDEDGNHETEL